MFKFQNIKFYSFIKKKSLVCDSKFLGNFSEVNNKIVIKHIIGISDGSKTIKYTKNKQIEKW